MPPCQNLGFCIAPGVCNCPDNFEGSECQIAKSKPCLDKPPTPMNSRVVCNEKECISTCNRGFTFPGGSKKLTMVCDAGNWVQRQQPPGTFQKVPDCQRNDTVLPNYHSFMPWLKFLFSLNIPTAVCDPACANGGRCLPNNFCECPQEFRGPQCNYRRSFRFQPRIKCRISSTWDTFIFLTIVYNFSCGFDFSNFYSCGELRPRANEL